MTDIPVDPTADKPPTARRLAVFFVLILLLGVGVLAHRARRESVNRIHRQLHEQGRLLDWQFDALRAAGDRPSQQHWARESEKTLKRIAVLKASLAEAEGGR